VVAVLVLLISSEAAAPALAQGTGRSLDIDVSLRSSAMGGASNALIRGGSLNHWVNPGLLGYVQGFRYERGTTQLVPGLAADVWLTTNFTKMGGGGVGFVFGGRPTGPPGIDLDYGVSQGSDEAGNPTAEFNSYERCESWGFGVNLIQGIESMLGVIGGDRTVSRFADVSFGMNLKDVQIVLGPGGEATTTNGDLGLVARLTPIDVLEGGGVLPIRLDLSYGRSRLNYQDNLVVFLNEDQASPLTRHNREGYAVQFATGIPGWTPERIESVTLRELLRGLMPILSVAATKDDSKIGVGDVVHYETHGQGLEVTVANLFAWRRGHYQDLVGDIDGDTHGWSAMIPIGKFGGVLYEEAWHPQARGSGLPDVHRKAYAVWIDPFAISRSLERR
jgi:hypothetical protein